MRRLLPILPILLVLAVAACGPDRRQTVVGGGAEGAGEAGAGDDAGQGEAVDPGEAGEAGDDGELGVEDADGESAEEGELGEAGEGVEAGEGGIEGEQGEAGEQGEEGEVGEEGQEGEAGEEGEGGEDPPEPVECGSADHDLPEGLDLVELAWDDGGGSTSITEQEGWIVAGQDLGVAPLNQTVRFDMEHPARIHAIRVRYQYLPEDPEAPLSIGIHPDFGHNGFDFWPHDTLWEGSLCREDVAAGGWTEFVLDPPLEVPHPVPLFVSHRRQQGGADWAFDLSLTNGCDNPPWCCNTYMECHSANNLPELIEFVEGNQQQYFWNGLSLSFWYDYMVRLVVEYDVDEADKIFTKLDDVEPGGKQAWEDVDGDGYDDLLLNGARLLRNLGDGEGGFEDISAAALPEGLAGSGGVFGDYDNDGCPDLFVFLEDPGAPDTLLHNVCDGSGHFEDVTEDAGLEDRQNYNGCENAGGQRWAAPTSSAAWVDINGDGLLDLYQGNEVCWDAGGFYADKVWLNDGDGFFEEWTGEDGFLGEEADDDKLGARGVNPVDFDGDGDVDIFVNNYHLHRNLLYVNAGPGDGDVEVEEMGEARGVAGELLPPEFGPIYGHSVGAAWGDIDGDGDFDLIIASLAHPRFYDFSDKSQVLMQDAAAGTFTDAQGDWSYPWGDTGIRYQEGHFSPVLFDADQDGALDLAISTAYQGRVTDFYWGAGDGTFELDAYHAGIKEEYGGGMATADLDHDGDLDLASAGGVWINDVAASDPSPQRVGHWLQIRLIGGPLSNRSAIGATARVTPAGAPDDAPALLRHVSGGNGYGCQDSHTLHFGLGIADTVTNISVDFPGAGTVEFAGPFDADQRLWLTEGGEVFEGWSPPAP